MNPPPGTPTPSGDRTPRPPTGLNRAGWQAWLSAYERAYEALPGPVPVRCPDCGADALHLVYTGLPRDRVGYGAFWCAACRYGVGLCRCPVPDGVPMLSVDTPAEERAALIPNFTLVAPDAGDEDGEDGGEDGDVVTMRF